MREDLLQRMNTSLTGVDRDFVHLFSSWFNRGFLVLSRMSWSSPASILEKIIAYEAVHEIKGWDDLRRRLDPHDRRCFAFFHPALVDEPLIFVEVALCGDMPGSIHTLLDSEGGAEDADPEPSVAVFYSISNCQEGLRGISFGNFLIKQVVEELTREVPSLKTFVTLSPAPSFRSWLFRALGDGQLAYLGEAERSLLHKIHEQGWSDEETEQDALRPAVLAAAAHYYLLAKDRSGLPLDPVARFQIVLKESEDAWVSISAKDKMGAMSGMWARRHCLAASMAIFCHRPCLAQAFSSSRRGTQRWEMKGMMR